MLEDVFDRLAEPFPPDAVSWRVGSSNKKRQQRENGPNAKATKGIALPYIDARDVMDRLDLVCGPAGWSCSYSHANGKTVCDIAIWCGDRGWVSKADGAGDSDIEAEKGALSDAFKRAAVRWGVGRYLYAISSPWVNLDEFEAIHKDEYAKLRKLLVDYTGVSVKSAAQAKRDKDFDYFRAQIEAATDLEQLGGIGREIKQSLPMLPASQRDPLYDAYGLRLNELKDAAREAA